MLGENARNIGAVSAYQVKHVWNVIFVRGLHWGGGGGGGLGNGYDHARTTPDVAQPPPLLHLVTAVQCERMYKVATR